MNIRFTAGFDREYKKCIKGNAGLEKKVKKQILILQNNIRHPSLRLHKLQQSQFWSASIGESIRILLIIDDQFITIYHIGKHEDVY
jgi:mRNA-degrading endonuclease YafQ of YafQ-DinJ toxin-antitoxin module